MSVPDTPPETPETAAPEAPEQQPLPQLPTRRLTGLAASGPVECPVCHKVLKSELAFAGHKKVHPEMAVTERQEKKRREAEQSRARSPETVYAEVKLRGPEIVYELMKERLFELLDNPQIKDDVKDYVLKEWDRDPTVRQDFNALSRLLAESGVEPRRANDVTNKMVAFYKQYEPALVQAGVQGFFGTTFQQQAPVSPYYPSTTPYSPQPYQSAFPQQVQFSQYPQFPPYQPQFASSGMSEREVSRMIDEKNRELENRIISALKPAQENEQLVEMDIPSGAVDENGKPVMQHVAGIPVSMVPSLIAMARASASQQKSPTDEAAINRITAPYRENLDQLKGMMDKISKDAEAARETANQVRIQQAEERAKQREEDYKNALGEIRDLEKDLRNKNTTSGYQSDVFRMGADALNKIATIAESKKPVEMLIRGLAPGQPPNQVRGTTQNPMRGQLEQLGLVDTGQQ